MSITNPNATHPSRRAGLSPVALVYGAIFIASILILGLSVWSHLAERDEIVTLTVMDDSGQVLQDAIISYDDQMYRSDSVGEVRLVSPEGPRPFTVHHDGYTTFTGEVSSGRPSQQTVQLARSPEGRDIAQETNQSTNPGSTGTSIEPGLSSDSEPTPEAATPEARMDAGSANQEVVGTLRNIDGEPIAQGWVTDGTSFAFSDADGNFLFEPGVVQPGATLTIFGAGYHEMEVPVPPDGEPLQVTLEHQKIRGLYLNPNISNTQADIDELIRIANTTEVNAVVIDIKEELVFFDTSVSLFRDAGVVTPILDLPALLKQFHDNGIYTIARLVVFKDSAVAEKYPNLAVIDNQTGGLWRDMNGIAWVNPMDHTLWDANIDLAVEAATLGFDEIQYDYIRFPTDGDLSRVSYGLENSQENREAAIEKFLERSQERLIPTGVKLSADIFGYTVLVEDDLGIGQNLDQLAAHVDYLSPMVYPSHWPEGSMALDGHPNDFPYETIEISMGLAVQQLDGNRLKFRPWLQDFDYWVEGSREYEEEEVRAQIDAVEDLGLSGWLIWDPNNWYHEGAFAPEANGTPAAQPATPAVATPAASTGATRKFRRA